MKNKILFDANPMVIGRKSGVGYYTQGLITALAEKYPETEFVGHYFNFMGRRRNPKLPMSENITYVESRLLPGKILSLTRKLGFQLPLELFFKQRGKAALFTNFVSLPSITGIPTAVAVHDLCFIEVPEYVSAKNRRFLQKFVPKSLHQAAKVITISESTKAAIKKYYRVADEKFIITPIPPSRKETKNLPPPKELSIQKKYILFVSTLEPRKNVINLVKAYEKLPDSLRSEYDLVLAGGEGWYMEGTMEYIKNLKDRNLGIVTTGYVSDKQRAALYQNASLFVFPSHYEGFGMPILEAMDYGIPTAISDIPVFREVAGNASVYFDKNDPKEITEAIKEVLSSKSLNEKLINAGHKNVSRFKWDTVAKEVYENIVKS